MGDFKSDLGELQGRFGFRIPSSAIETSHLEGTQGLCQETLGLGDTTHVEKVTPRGGQVLP